MKQKLRELPLGISDFQLVRKQDYYYVDKTMFIPKMESAGNYLFLVRPRRFGKTLFLSMLESYYDCKQADRYDELFNGLWIQENTTKRRGMYQVLKLDFSQIAGPIDHLEENFNEYCNIQLNLFAQKYADMYDEGYVEEVKEYKEAVSKLIFICGKAKACGHPLYLIVDEYDNFTNTVLSVQGRNIYHDLTHGEGFYQDIFKIFKSNFERILMLGVSPVMLDDLTSGYNIATNITAEHPFNMMLGLSETEVREMLAYYHEAGLLQVNVETMIQEMKPWYDNYCFSVDSLDRDPKVFNVYMVMYYLRERLETGRSPEKMLAPNTGIDYTKLQQLLLLDTLTDRRKSTIFEILEKGYVYGNLIDHFPADRLADADNFTSLLYYYGMLTITGRRGFSLKLSIPNNNVRKQYYEYLRKEYENIKLVDISQLQMAFTNAVYDGQWRPMLQYIADAYRESASIRSLIEGERNIHGFFTAYLGLNPYCLVAPEVELNHGYCDFFMLPDQNRANGQTHSYIVELKYLTERATDNDAQKQWDEAVDQIRGYGEGRKVRQLAGNTQLHLIVMQFKTYTLLRMEEIRES